MKALELPHIIKTAFGRDLTTGGAPNKGLAYRANLAGNLATLGTYDHE